MAIVVGAVGNAGRNPSVFVFSSTARNEGPASPTLGRLYSGPRWTPNLLEENL